MRQHLVSIQQMAALLGVSRQRVYQLTDDPTFPHPEATLAVGRIWSREAVITWARCHGRVLTQVEN